MSNTKSAHVDSDNLAADLFSIIQTSYPETSSHEPIDEHLLMEKLVSYIVERDHKVFDHAYKLGQKGKK